MTLPIGDFLVLHLPELVKTSFVAATSDVMELRLIGYESLKVCSLDCV